MPNLSRATGTNDSNRQVSVTAWNQVVDGLNNIPITPQDYGAVGNGVTDDTTAFQDALNAINAAGGGALYIPEGTYKISSYLTVYPYTTIQGAGAKIARLTTAMAGGGGANAFENVRNGSIFNTIAPINSSTRAQVAIKDLMLECTNSANVGAGYMDRCNTFIQVKNVRIDGFKYGIVFDQTELADIVECDFEAQTSIGFWIVNGADLNPGASSGFTNRIGVKNCQFNHAPTAYCIVDDGGYTHSYEENNYNGGLTHIRLSGAFGVRIAGGEFESAAGAIIVLSHLTLAGAASGAAGPVHIDAALLVPSAGQSCINIVSAGTIVLNAPFLGSSTASKVVGCVNANAIFSIGAVNGGGGASFDGTATNHWAIDHGGLLTTNITNANDIKLAATRGVYVNNVKVVGTQQAANPDTSGATLAALETEVNELKAALRAHGLIAT